MKPLWNTALVNHALPVHESLYIILLEEECGYVRYWSTDIWHTSTKHTPVTYPSQSPKNYRSLVDRPSPLQSSALDKSAIVWDIWVLAKMNIWYAQIWSSTSWHDLHNNWNYKRTVMVWLGTETPRWVQKSVSVKIVPSPPADFILTVFVFVNRGGDYNIVGKRCKRRYEHMQLVGIDLHGPVIVIRFSSASWTCIVFRSTDTLLCFPQPQSGRCAFQSL